MIPKHNILVVDDESSVLSLLKDALDIYQDRYNVHTASDGQEAVQVLTSTPVDLVLTDINMPRMNGFELMAYMSRNHRNIPIITMTGFNSPQVSDRAKSGGSFYHLEKPVKLADLMGSVSDALQTRTKGYIHGVTLPTFLQMVGQEGKTCTLEVKSKGRMGQLYVRNGRLVDAEAGNLRGTDAALDITLWEEPEIYLHKTVQRTEESMDASMQYILLEAARMRDESSHTSSSPSADHLLKQAIGLAESCRLREAQNQLAKLLKLNPRNHAGWLWYSRIAGSMKSTETSLKNAIRISPQDSEIIEESKKFDLAKKHIVEDQVRRCPFCWSPVKQRGFQCQHCEAHLFIHKEFFGSTRSARQNVLLEAIERYKKVDGLETNMLANYYLGIAYLNLEHWEEALSQLDKSVKLAPEKQSLSNQLRLLLDFMASAEVQPEQKKPAFVGGFDPKLSTEFMGKRKRILVVEDSSTTRKVITITLSQNNYEVIEARDGLEALSKVNEKRPDLILLDILLPKMDGYRILSIIKNSEQLKYIPVIMLTSKDGFIDKVKGKLSGSAEYLTKPFDPKQLVKTVEKYL